MKLDKIPSELMEGRDSIECNFIFSLWQDPYLISSYSNVKVGEDIITIDGRFYYSLLLALNKSELQTFDDMSITTYLEAHPKVNQKFEEYGGFNSLHEIINKVNPKNIEGFYDALAKSNLLIRLNAKGFDVISHLDKFAVMTAEEVYSYYEYLLSDAAVTKIERVEVESLNDGYEAYINQWDKGEDVGYRINSGMLNYALAGVHRGSLLLWGANIGHGKTTSSVIQLVMPALMNGVNTLIASNEQGVSIFRQMTLGAAMFNHFKTPAGMNRRKIMTGGYTDEQRKSLREAADWIKQQKGKLDFAELTSYDAHSLTKLIRKYSRLGYTMFIIDTLKPANDSNDKMWGEFSEVSKELSLLAKNLDVAIVCTFQLTPDSQARKYLDLTCVGKSRAIAETAHAVVMFRHIHSDEYERLKPYTYVKNEDGTKTKTEVELDENKTYVMFFMPKNRSGNTAPQIVMEFDQDFLRMKDVGYYNQSPEAYRR